MRREAESRRLNLLLGIALVALVTRLTYLSQIGRAPFFGLRIGDADAYHRWALQIAGGNWRGEGVFYQAPLYPYLLALVYRVLGSGPGMVRLVQLIVGAGSCVLLAAAGMELFGELGAIAGVLLALYPPAIFLDGLLEKSALVTFLTAALLLALAVRRSTGRDLLAGITLGLLTLTRENALALAVPILLWLIYGERARSAEAVTLQRRSSWRSATTFLAGCAIVLLPVAARNAAVGGDFTLTTSQFGPNFYIGNHAGARGTYDPLVTGHGSAADERDDATRVAEAASGHPLTAGQVSAYWRGRALEFIRAHPLEWIGQLLRKLGLMYNALEISDTESPDVYAQYSWLLRALSPFSFGVVLCLAAFGVCMTAPDWRRIWFLHAILLTYTASVVVFYVFGRYRFPLVPVLLLFAAGGVAMWRDARARRVRWLALAAIVPAAFVAWLPLQNAAVERVIGYVTVANAFSQDQSTWPEAAAFYDEALTELPRSPAAHYGVGRLLAQMHQPKAAIDHYRIALEGWPDNDAIREDLALAQAALDEQHRARPSADATPPTTRR